MTESTKPIAAVITEWRRNSHADVILSRVLEPELWGHEEPYRLRLAAVYADQFPENDLCRSYCERFDVPIFPTFEGAIGVGTDALEVDGVLLIGEHGDYPRNAKGQQMYPRAPLLDGILRAFRRLGGTVPVFCDKHLSYEWLLASWMVQAARRQGVPLMAGSSLPVAWRVPEWTMPMGAELESAFALGYGGLDAYGFHALETLQCQVERRQGGENGVEAVRCLSGQDVWDGLKRGLWSRELLDALLPVRRLVNPDASSPTPRDRDALFLIRYRDGLEAAVGMFNSVGRCFAFSARRAGAVEADAAVFDLEPDRPYGHFGHLLRAIEHMIWTGTPAYPVERTLLTTGMLSALLQSRSEGGPWIKTPHLAAIQYEPSDWPFASGPRGTPA